MNELNDTPALDLINDLPILVDDDLMSLDEFMLQLDNGVIDEINNIGFDTP